MSIIRYVCRTPGGLASLPTLLLVALLVLVGAASASCTDETASHGPGKPARPYAYLQDRPRVPVKEGAQAGHLRGEGCPARLSVVPAVILGRVSIEAASSHAHGPSPRIPLESGAANSPVRYP